MELFVGSFPPRQFHWSLGFGFGFAICRSRGYGLTVGSAIDQSFAFWLGQLCQRVQLYSLVETGPDNSVDEIAKDTAALLGSLNLVFGLPSPPSLVPRASAIGSGQMSGSPQCLFRRFRFRRGAILRGQHLNDLGPALR